MLARSDVWLQVQQGLEMDSVSGVIPDNLAHNILTGGINLLKMANLLEPHACKLKDESPDRLNVALVGADISSLWAPLKDTLGMASKTGYMYKEEPLLKCSCVSSVASDIATEEDIAPAVPGTSVSLHSATSTLVHLTTSSLDQ